MNQEKISELIKKLRKKDNLTQGEFAKKYNVTFQAVSKWENGKSLPDIVLLKQICKDYNISIDEILDGKINKKNKYFLLIIPIIILGLILIFKDNDFEFKTLSSSCSNFKISGSIAYSNNKSHLHLSNINYCGNTDTTEYIKIECILYEKEKKVNKELDKVYYEGQIKLEDFLESVEFELNDFSKSCKNYSDDSLYLEINATNKENKTTNYKVTLTINECN